MTVKYDPRVRRTILHSTGKEIYLELRGNGYSKEVALPLAKWLAKIYTDTRIELYKNPFFHQLKYDLGGIVLFPKFLDSSTSFRLLSIYVNNPQLFERVKKEVEKTVNKICGKYNCTANVYEEAYEGLYNIYVDIDLTKAQ